MVPEGKNLVAYTGDEPYVFLSYSHKDQKIMKKIVSGLNAMHYRVWFDTQGITPAVRWDEMIAQRIEKCGYLIALISKNYLESHNCREELELAWGEKRFCLLIYLEKDAKLTGALKLHFWNSQSLKYWNFTTIEKLLEKITESKDISKCREKAVAESEAVAEPKAVAEDKALGSKTTAKFSIAEAFRHFWPALLALVLLIVLSLSLNLLSGQEGDRNPSHIESLPSQEPDAEEESTNNMKEFEKLCEEGDLFGAYDWLMNFEGVFTEKDNWLQTLECYKPYCGEWSFGSGDPTLLSEMIWKKEKSSSFTSRVIIKDDAVTLRIHFVEGENEYSIDMDAMPDSEQFWKNHSGSPYYYTVEIDAKDRFICNKFEKGDYYASVMYTRNDSLIN